MKRKIEKKKADIQIMTMTEMQEDGNEMQS